MKIKIPKIDEQNESSKRSYAALKKQPNNQTNNQPNKQPTNQTNKQTTELGSDIT